MALSRWIWRGTFLILATGWAWLMLLAGLLLIARGPAGIPDWSRQFALPAGVILVAAGVFVCAVVADRLFPLADRRVSGTVELAAWGAILLAFILGIVI